MQKKRVREIGGDFDAGANRPYECRQGWGSWPDGGGLWSRRMPAVSYEQGEDRFSAYRTLAQREKEDYLQTGEGTAKKDFLAKFKEAERFLDTDPALRPMSDASKKSLQRLHFEKIAARRNGNALTLHEELKGTGIGCLLPKHFCAPLYFPILVKEQERVQREMALADIYCPVIWKIPDQARAVCPVSTRISQAMLAVPCDQRYSKEDMLLVAAALRRIAG